MPGTKAVAQVNPTLDGHFSIFPTKVASQPGTPSHITSPHSSREEQTPTRKKNYRKQAREKTSQSPGYQLHTFKVLKEKMGTIHELIESFFPTSLFKPQVPIWQITGNGLNFKNRSSFLEKSELMRFVWKS